MACEPVSVEIDKFNEYNIIRLSQLPGSGSIFVYKPSAHGLNFKLSQRTSQLETRKNSADHNLYSLNFDFEQVCGDSTNLKQKIFVSLILEDLCKLMEGPIVLLLSLRSELIQKKETAFNLISEVSNMFVQQTRRKTLNLCSDEQSQI